MFTKKLDGFDPADGAGDLILERGADGIGTLGRLREEVGDDRDFRSVELGDGEGFAKLGLGSGHEAGVVGSGDFEFFAHAEAVFLGFGDGVVDAFFCSGEDGLAGAVEIGNVDVAILGEAGDVLVRSSDHGGHGAGIGLAGFIHELAAAGDEFEAFFEGEGAGGAMSGHFTKGKPGGSGGFEGGDFFTEDLEQSEAVEKKGGLAIPGAREVLGGAVEHDVGEGTAKDLVGLFEEGFGGGIGFDEILAHADFLGTLSGEEKNCFAHKERANPVRAGGASHLAHELYE